MKVRIEEGKQGLRILINEPRPVVKFSFKPEGVLFDGEVDGFSREVMGHRVGVKEDGAGLLFIKDLGLREHVLGLGEKAFELDRRRVRVRMWNTDSYAYTWYHDPLYVSIPFFISVRGGEAVGFFINSPAELTFDIGIRHYHEVMVSIPHRDVEIYVIRGPTIERVLENYTDITGKPLDPPDWALDLQFSRCCGYEPQDVILRIIDEMEGFGVKPGVVYLDLQHMDSNKIFTWDREKFPRPRELIDELHRRGVKLVTIVDPYVKLDQNYEVFLSGLGNYCETPNGELYVGRGWPGAVVFPDFYNVRARDWWAGLIERWVRDYGVDGIWIDMNEPTDLGRADKCFDGGVVHRLDDGGSVRHELVRNAYPYFEAMATYEGLRRAGVDKPFILSRSGYAGIQSYAFLWTGDNVPSQEDILLQLQLIESLGLSGVPFVGCDIGGFAGRPSLGEYRIYHDQGELLVRYFRAALFFPLLRVHTSDNPDREFYMLRSDYANAIKRAVELRRNLMPYLLALAREAHETGHPIVRPLVYEFQDDEDAYHIIDEYLVGKHLLYAPQIYGEARRVYLPRGKWSDWWTCEEYEGPTWIETKSEFPLFIRYGSVIPTTTEVRVYGPGSIRLRDGTTITSDGHGITPRIYNRVIIYGENKCVSST
ncbi:alpha-glucosidase MalA [Vulcanisaeta thermophila]|uniref:alpha-glucosidase MalA n=1 Tax=Vulcanisaeta thermophila TaxID=867917 RepID=UPI000852ED49|nr:alpha-glucosidase MalA [Vulcanisaeta thermophila]